MSGKWWLGVLVAGIIFNLWGCKAGPEPIRVGEDTCAYCKMVISDPRYGGELVTKKGRVYKFDSVECLAAFYLTEQVPPEEVASLWVVVFDKPGKLIPAEKAIYLHSPNLRSPMGLNLSAYDSQEVADKLQLNYAGEFLTWEEVLELVKKEWLSNGGRPPHQPSPSDSSNN